MRCGDSLPCCCWCCTAMATLPQSEPLRVSWSSHNAPPFAIVEREQFTGGLIFDLGNALAARLGTTATFVDVPRARYEAQLRGGRIDITCMTNPKWLADPGALTWSPPLFEESDVLVQQSGTSHLDGRL
jgi:polar amino acid transport system substrate-binding protein